MGERRQARIAAFQALYAWEESGEPIDSLLSFNWLDKKPEQSSAAFASLIIQGTIENIERIDNEIKSNLKKWSFERLSRVDLAILRIAAYEIIFQEDIPPTVTIDEAVEISKRFSSPDSYKFVNGVLDGIRKANLS